LVQSEGFASPSSEVSAAHEEVRKIGKKETNGLDHSNTFAEKNSTNQASHMNMDHNLQKTNKPKPELLSSSFFSFFIVSFSFSIAYKPLFWL
jgi:hypothetical protein